MTNRFFYLILTVNPQGGAVISFTTMTVSSGGYSWTYKNPFKLSGSASSKKYTSLSKALTACGCTL